MATTFWKRRLGHIRDELLRCEAVELVMIREAKPVSDAAHKAALAAIIEGVADEMELLNHPAINEPESLPDLARRHVRQERIERQMFDQCLSFGMGDVKIGSICFYAPSLLKISRVDAIRDWQKLDEMFTAAGGVLEVVPANIQSQLSPLAMAFTDRKLRWAACVFDMACRQLPGVTRATRIYLGEEKPGSCWYATLKNVMASSVELIDWLLAVDQTPSEDPAEVNGNQQNGKRPVKKKASTQKGEARAKCISALIAWHEFENGGCLNTEPISVSELKRQSGVGSKSSVTRFFNACFGGPEKTDGHRKYKIVCRDAPRLIESLRVLNGDFSPDELYGRRPPGESERRDDD